MNTQAMPNYLLSYDGDCRFCEFCVAHARVMTAGAVDFVPYQKLSAEFRRQHALDYAAAIHLFDGDQLLVSGAGAAFFIRALAGKPRWWRCYQRHPRFAGLSEWLYRWVSRHRGACHAVARRFWPEP